MLESLSSVRFLVLKRFSATAKVSRPGRSPASKVSLAGCAPAFAAVCELDCAVGAEVLVCGARTTSARLRHSQNLIEPGFKVFLPLGPQPDALHGHGFLHHAHPTH